MEMKKEKKRHRTWINKHHMDNYIMRSAYYANLLQKHKHKHKHKHTLSLHKIKRKLVVKKTLSKAKQNKRRQETYIERRSCHRTPLLPRKGKTKRSLFGR
jgi:hypothetical protein